MELPLKVDFTGKVVVVTGAGGILCGTMAKAFAQAGAKVAALDLNEESVKKLSEEVKGEGFICEGYGANVLESSALWIRTLRASWKKRRWRQYTIRFGKSSAPATFW